MGFQRTCRVPEGKLNSLPAGLGYFPVFKVSDFTYLLLCARVMTIAVMNGSNAMANVEMVILSLSLTYYAKNVESVVFRPHMCG